MAADELDVDVLRSFDGNRTLAIVFGERRRLASTHVGAELGEVLLQAHIVGCSTAGHFVDSAIVDDVPVVTLLQFEHTDLRVATVALAGPEHSMAVGQQLAEQLAHPDLAGVLVLSDGLACNGSALVDGLLTVLPSDVAIFGGLAADGDAFVETAVLDGRRLAAGRVVAIGFVGARVEFSSGSAGGWSRFGPERTITASSDSVLERLGNEPALDIYRRYLADRADELPGSGLLFPLAIRPPESTDDFHLVRTLLAITESDDSMTFAGDMPVGWQAQMMWASFDDLVDGAVESAEAAAPSPGSVAGDQVALAVSCVGRRLVMGSRTEDELEAVADVLGDATTLVGYYSYGELGPGLGGRCALHNQTMTLTVIRER